MKVFMLWDMEGVSGIGSREQVWFWEPGVRPEVAEAGRRLPIEDINAAAAAALGAGVRELTVCDTHRGGGNIAPEEMLGDPRVTYLTRSRGYQDGKLRWLPGLDHTVDGFLVPGHHAKAGTANAFLPHTWSLEWADFRINGRSVGEMGIEACFAGHWEVPVIFAQGDEAACTEAEATFPGIITASVKRAADANTAIGPDPTEARRLTADTVVEAIEALRLGRCAPFQPDLPMTVAVDLTTVEEAEKVAGKPNVVRVAERTVECVVERYCDVVSWIVPAGLDMPALP